MNNKHKKWRNRDKTSSIPPIFPFFYFPGKIPKNWQNEKHPLFFVFLSYYFVLMSRWGTGLFPVSGRKKRAQFFLHTFLFPNYIFLCITIFLMYYNTFYILQYALSSSFTRSEVNAPSMAFARAICRCSDVSPCCRSIYWNSSAIVVPTTAGSSVWMVALMP